LEKIREIEKQRREGLILFEAPREPEKKSLASSAEKATTIREKKPKEKRDSEQTR